MRKLVILLALCTVGCTGLTKRQFTPPVKIYSWDACILDTQYPKDMYCQNVNSSAQKKIRKLTDEKVWVVLSLKDFTEVVTFFRQYCAENIAACKDVAREIRKEARDGKFK